MLSPPLKNGPNYFPKWEVAAKLTEIGFSMGVAQTVSDLADCEHLRARHMFVETDDSIGGKFPSLRTPIWLTECEDIENRTPPILGQNNKRY
ncbi:MAG: hypothetical protein CM1200mP15_08490 [Dehalococcoidia bacterium]|nr:MAG: hypothetical protein CM1200mP15_08490 [Dehalococcoidia bacterium]